MTCTARKAPDLRSIRDALRTKADPVSAFFFYHRCENGDVEEVREPRNHPPHAVIAPGNFNFPERVHG